MPGVNIANGSQVIDLTAAKRFFDLMAEGEAVTFQTFSDRDKSPRLARIIHGTIDERADELAELNRDGAGVFIMVNFGDGKGRSATNVTGVRSLFVDLDGAPLAPVYEAGLSPPRDC